MDASDNEIMEILMDDQVLDVLETVGYNGVPSRENKHSVKKIIEYVNYYKGILFSNQSTLICVSKLSSTPI